MVRESLGSSPTVGGPCNVLPACLSLPLNNIPRLLRHLCGLFISAPKRKGQDCGHTALPALTACDVLPASHPGEVGTPRPKKQDPTSHKGALFYKSRSGRGFYTCKTTCKKQRLCSGKKSLCAVTLRARVRGHRGCRAGSPPLHQTGVWVGKNMEATDVCSTGARALLCSSGRSCLGPEGPTRCPH